VHATLPLMRRYGFPALRRTRLETLQVNLGYRCNQSCLHCHVNAGPNRTESMSRETVADVTAFLGVSGVRRLDLTGGAPELNPHFRELVLRARELGVHVVDRCNLTILEEPGQEGLAEFLAHQQVEVVASLPCYLEENVDRQRGRGVFERSLRGIARLNALGLEAEYKRILAEQHGVRFNHLYTLANMPIQRFGSTLVSKGRFDEYMALLKGAHREENLGAVMCRSLISVDWQGRVYDCDFNQMLGLPLVVKGRERIQLSDLIGRDLEGNPIAVRDHCYGCTAGQGSSCGGALGG